MSSLGQNTTISSVPPGNTPSFFRRISNAYSVALDALLSPSPTRPDPFKVDPGPSPTPAHSRPPRVIDVETVYSIDASQPTYHGTSDHSSPNYTGPVTSPDSSPDRPTSPISLFPSTTHPTLSGPEPIVPPVDAFSQAFPGDPGMSSINHGVIAPTASSRPTAPVPSTAPTAPAPTSRDAAPPGFFSPIVPPPSSINQPQLHQHGTIIDHVPLPASQPSSTAITQPAASAHAYNTPALFENASSAPLPTSSPPSAPPSTTVSNRTAVAPSQTWHQPVVSWNLPAASPPSTTAPTAVPSSAISQRPVHMPTPWSHAALAGTNLHPDFVPQGPSALFTPNPYGSPGFQAACAPSPAPTMVSPALDLVSSPRFPMNGRLTRSPQVSKHHRGDDAVDIEKLVNIATASLSSEYSLRYITDAGIIDPTEYSPKLADYFTNHSLTVDELMNRFIDFDMLASVEMYEHFDVDSARYGGRTFNLLTESHLVSLPRVLEWQYYCRANFAAPDQLSDKMVYKLIMKTLHHSVRSDVAYELSELPEHQRGGAVTLKLAMDKLSANSFEIRNCIQRGLTSFVITAYPQENVTLASQHIKTLARICIQHNELPPRVVVYILRGMAKSSHDSFNSLCEQFILREQIDYKPPEFGINVQKSDYDQLLLATSKLSQFYRDAVQSGSWPAASKSSSSLVVSKPTTTATIPGIPNDDVETIVSALMTRLSTNPTSPRSPSSRYFPSAQYPCSNCGATDHWHRECPHPRQTPRPDSRSDSRSRPRSISRSRPDHRPRDSSRSRSRTPLRRDSSRPSSRSNSRDAQRGRPILRNPTPGHTRDTSRDRTVDFDASVHNVTVSSQAPSAADLLRSINGRSSN